MKESMVFVERNSNFNKNETESKMENPTQTFKETNLALQLIYEFRIINYKLLIKIKTVMSWSSRKKNECVFFNIYFFRRHFFNICVLSHCRMYWKNFLKICTFTNKKHINSYTFLHIFKIVESLQCTLNYMSLPISYSSR